MLVSLSLPGSNRTYTGGALYVCTGGCATIDSNGDFSKIDDRCGYSTIEAVPRVEYRSTVRFAGHSSVEFSAARAVLRLSDGGLPNIEVHGEHYGA